MKNRQIWLVIACILVVGAAVTLFTKSFGRQSQKMEALETAVEEEAAGEPQIAAAQVLDGQAIEGEQEENVRSLPSAAPMEEEALPESVAAAEVLVASADSASSQQKAPRSPALPADGSGEGAGQEGTDYRRRLEELDRQIIELEEEGAGTNVYSAQTSQASELKLWESEMNGIYNSLLKELPQAEAEVLAKEQQQWLKERDIKATGKDAKSKSLKGVEYTAALAELTRERAYELVDLYEELNQPETQRQG